MPFRAFELVMNDGRAFLIEHPELLFVASEVVTDTNLKEGYFTHLEPVLIATMAQWLDGEPSGEQPAPTSE
jgi:hypothetical protein